MNRNVDVTYSAADQTEEQLERVVLQQDTIDPVRRYAKIGDIEQMISRARSGLSAQTYSSAECPAIRNADGSVTVVLGFHAWPYPVDLSYNLHPAQGVISEGERVFLEREFDLLVPMTDRVELPFVMTDLNVTFQTNCYNDLGQVIAQPTITQDGTALVLSSSVFCVLRISCVANGYHHDVTMHIVRALSDINADRIADGEEPYDERDVPNGMVGVPGPTQGYEGLITEQDLDYWRDVVGDELAVDSGDVANTTGYNKESLSNSITATWTDSDGKTGSDILELDIPGCVEDLLNICPDGKLKGGLDWSRNDTTPVLYYSTCTGNVMEYRDE